MSNIAPDKGPKVGAEIRLPSFRLDGRLAIITGASQGIGRTIALAYASAGAHVILGSRRREALQQVQAEIQRNGGTADIGEIDVQQVQSIAAFFSRVESSLPKERPPIVLVNNAGNAFTKLALEVSEQDWDEVLNTHLKGTFFCAQAGAKLMISSGYGKIINMSSTWSASTDARKSVYCAAKAGISHLTAALATEWAAHGVRVTAIAPTAVTTAATERALSQDPVRAERILSRIPLGRYERTEDLIGTALLLASEASDFITGQTIFVDGGWNGGR